MPRFLRARDQVEMLAPWLRLAAPKAPKVPPREWDGLPGDPWTKSLKKLDYTPPDLENDPGHRLKNTGSDFETITDVLHSHLLGANAEQHRQGRHWYNVARNVFTALAKDRGISKARAVAIGAAFSPLTDWGKNIQYASDFLLRYRPNDPDHNEDDWMMAHIHPKALQAFRENEGRDPTHSDEDLHRLADLHAPHFARGENRDAVNDLSNPQARAAWMQNIQHHGMDKVLDDHVGQVHANRNAEKGGVVVGYNPTEAMRDYGIPTLGGNIKKAKALLKAPENPREFFKILGGPKIWNFSRNILNHPGWNGAWGRTNGYYLHPNGDWTQHEDLGGTIDAHHLRAASMRHGEWVDSGYHDGAKGLEISSKATYDVYNRSLLEATRRYNAGIADPRRHITPKQAQAIIWKKHKDDNEWFRKHGVISENQLPKKLRRVPDRFSKDPKAYFQNRAKPVKPKKAPAPQPVRAAALTPQEFMSLPPLWREMIRSRRAMSWQDLLTAFMTHHGLHSEESEFDPRLGQLLDNVADVLYYSASVEKMSIPENPEGDWSAKLYDHIQNQPWPGHTTKDVPGDGPTRGYMVSIPEHAGKPYPYDQLSPEQLAEFARSRRDVVNGDPDTYMGGWREIDKDGDNWYDDVSENDLDPWSAARKADERREKGVYDLNEDRTIPTDEMMAQTHWGGDPNQPGWIFSRRQYE